MTDQKNTIDAMIDLEKFNSQYQSFDNQFIVGLIDLFIKEYPDRIIRLRENVSTKNFGRFEGQLGFNAHSLKSVLSNFWDPVSFEYARRLVELDRNETEEGLFDLVEKLDISVRTLIMELMEIRKKLLS